jgi:hypothetical protein
MESAQAALSIRSQAQNTVLEQPIEMNSTQCPKLFQDLEHMTSKAILRVPPKELLLCPEDPIAPCSLLDVLLDLELTVQI